VAKNENWKVRVEVTFRPPHGRRGLIHRLHQDPVPEKAEDKHENERNDEGNETSFVIHAVLLITATFDCRS
jgi:hypothetical protein